MYDWCCVCIHVHKNTRDVCAGSAEAKVLLLYTASHECACLAWGGHCDICVITCLNFSFAAVLVWFDSLNYTVTEGDTVNITLVTNTTDYEFDFSVSLLETMNGSATGELLIYSYLLTPWHTWATGVTVVVCVCLYHAILKLQPTRHLQSNRNSFSATVAPKLNKQFH